MNVTGVQTCALPIYGTIELKTLSGKILVFHLVGPFRIAKRPFLGPTDLQLLIPFTFTNKLVKI